MVQGAHRETGEHSQKLFHRQGKRLQCTAHVNRDEQGFDRYLAVQGWFNNML